MPKCAAALVVEDEESVQRLLQAILRRHCESVDVAGDGEIAIEMVRRRSYDLVLLDLMLPKVNGLEVSAAIQQLPRRPKLIVLSAVARYFGEQFPEDAVVLQKPFELDRLEEVILALE